MCSSICFAVTGEWLDANISTDFLRIWQVGCLYYQYVVLEAWSFICHQLILSLNWNLFWAMFSCLVTQSVGFCWWELWRKLAAFTCEGIVSGHLIFLDSYPDSLPKDQTMQVCWRENCIMFEALSKILGITGISKCSSESSFSPFLIVL